MDPEIEARLNRKKHERVSRNWAPVNSSSSSTVPAEKEPLELTEHIAPGLRSSITKSLGVGGGGDEIQSSLIQQFEKAAEIDRKARGADEQKKLEAAAAILQRAEEQLRAAEHASADEKRVAEEARAAAAEVEKRRRPSFIERQRAAKEKEREGAARKKAEAAAAAERKKQEDRAEVQRAVERNEKDKLVRDMSLEQLREPIVQVAREMAHTPAAARWHHRVPACLPACCVCVHTTDDPCPMVCPRRKQALKDDGLALLRVCVARPGRASHERVRGWLEHTLGCNEGLLLDIHGNRVTRLIDTCVESLATEHPEVGTPFGDKKDRGRGGPLKSLSKLTMGMGRKGTSPSARRPTPRKGKGKGTLMNGNTALYTDDDMD